MNSSKRPNYPNSSNKPMIVSNLNFGRLTLTNYYLAAWTLKTILYSKPNKMDFNIKPSEKILVTLTNGDIFEGVYQSGSKNRINVIDITEYPWGSKILGTLCFYKKEIESVTLLNSETQEEHLVNGKDENQKNVILLTKAEYERLKQMSVNYIYMSTMDCRFFEAVEYLNNCETVGVFGIGSEFGRQRNISVLVMSSWDQVYLFDVLSYKLSDFHPKLKELLESDSVKKVVHNSRTLVDCLHHCHRVKLVNIFDTQVADLMISKKDGQPLKDARNISACLQHYLNFPKSLLEKSLVGILHIRLSFYFNLCL